MGSRLAEVADRERRSRPPGGRCFRDFSIESSVIGSPWIKQLQCKERAASMVARPRNQNAFKGFQNFWRPFFVRGIQDLSRQMCMAQASAEGTIKLAELWPEHGPCLLCGAVGPLCRSHIIPKFVGDWLRGSNVTGRLRSNRTPNRLVQDLEWRHMLCAACEGRFSVFETEVCENVFLPIHERRQDRFRYGASFARFAVSVAWRALVVFQREGRLGHLNEIPGDVEAAELAWREFLLEGRSSPAPHVMHALPMDVPTNLNPEGLSPHFGRFVLRTPAVGTQCHRGAGYVIVKMARLNVFGVVAPGNERREWQATQIHVERGSWGVEEYHSPGWVRLLFERGAANQEKCFQNLSPKQEQLSNDKIWEAIDEDVDAVASSDVFRAFEADVKLFGKQVFQDAPDSRGAAPALSTT
jgi:hypothetical protein